MRNGWSSGFEPAPAEVSLSEWLTGLRIGEPRSHVGLGLVPLYHDGPIRRARYRILAEAIAAGDAIVTEKPDATVPTLRLRNLGDMPVLAIDGEEIVGGRQNRVVDVTLVVPARSAFDLPVSCVEHGRWRASTPTFDPGEAVYPTLRQQKMDQVAESLASLGTGRTDQGAIWDEIAVRHQVHGTRSATGALDDAYTQRETDLLQAEMELACPEDGPLGVVALVGGRATCADVFDRPETLRAYWPRLVRSYALEALGTAPVRPTKGAVKRFVGRALRAERQAFPGAGLGADVRVRGADVVGAALIFDGAVVHTALFRRCRSRRNDTLFQSPTQRARRLSD